MMTSRKIHFVILAALVLICFGMVLIYGALIEPDRIRIQSYQMQTRIQVPELKGKTIVQLSDLHIKKYGPFHEQLIQQVNSLTPDFIFLTGDYIQWKGDNQGVIQFLSGLKAKNGIFAVMGDYDYSDSRKSCLFCHESVMDQTVTRKHPVRFLRNNMISIPMEEGQLRVAGMDQSYNEFSREKMLESIQVDSSDFLIVLSHTPFGFDLLEQQENVLMFAGDTHGGQILLPRWIYSLLGYDKNATYNYGFYQNGKNHLYVNRGIGTSHVKFRLFCPPEIAVFYF